MERLDKLLVMRGIVQSRARARRLIEAGGVLVNGASCRAADERISESAKIVLSTTDIPWVSRAGEKLAAAIENWGIEVDGMVCLDVGSSTGGFTDVLLTFGAKKVYAVDVGSKQLHERLRSDPRIISWEETDIRDLDQGRFAEPIDLAVVDVSFISLTHVLPAVHRIIRDGGVLLALVKPQFEVGKDHIGRGVVRDEAQRRGALEKVRTCAQELGFLTQGTMSSPITGGEGNVEYLLYAMCH